MWCDVIWARENQYTRPPIVEAVLELRFRAEPEMNLGKLRELLVGEDEYRAPVEAIDREAMLTFSEDSLDSTIRRESHGYVFKSTDDRRILRVFPGYLSVSELAPYSGWDSFSAEALRVWGKYRKIVEPEQLNRIGVRYINRLDLPGETVRLEDYLHTFPQVSADVSAPMVRFLFNTNHILPEKRVAVSLSLASVDSERPGSVSVLLDVDAYRDEMLSVEASNLDEIPSILEELREVKNLFFEASITNRVREMIA